jgi:hypothetical protein
MTKGPQERGCSRWTGWIGRARCCDGNSTYPRPPLPSPLALDRSIPGAPVLLEERRFGSLNRGAHSRQNVHPDGRGRPKRPGGVIEVLDLLVPSLSMESERLEVQFPRFPVGLIHDSLRDVPPFIRRERPAEWRFRHGPCAVASANELTDEKLSLALVETRGLPRRCRRSVPHPPRVQLGPGHRLSLINTGSDPRLERSWAHSGLDAR